MKHISHWFNISVFLFWSSACFANAGDVSGALAIGTSYANIVTAPTNGMVIQGSVGIGTASPSSPLDVAGLVNTGTGYQTKGAGALFPMYLDNTSGATNAKLWFPNSVNGNALISFIANDADTASTQYEVVIRNGYAVTSVVFPSGNIGIGQLSPAYLLHVGSSTASGIVAELQNSSGACTHSPNASSETVSCSSDVRFKKNIKDATGGLAWINDLRIRDFTVVATGEERTGVVAQEVISHHPEMVHLDKTGFYMVEQPNPWKLVEVIQEQQRQIDTQQKEIDQLTHLVRDERIHP